MEDISCGVTVSSLNAGVGCLKNRRDVSFKSEHLPFYLCVAERKTVVEVTPCRSLLSVVGFLCVFFFPLKVAPEGRVPLRLIADLKERGGSPTPPPKNKNSSLICPRRAIMPLYIPHGAN